LTERPDVSVVVVSFNAREHLQRCLSAVDGEAYEVVVVDNGSNDGSGELVQARFPLVQLLQLDSNVGLPAANNAGIRVASGRYILLLNSDAWPREHGIAELARLVDAHPEIGAAGPRLLNPDGSLQRSVRGFPTLWRLATEYFFLRKLAPRSGLLNAFYGAGFPHDEPRDVEWVTSAVLLLRREAVDAVGGFDPSFFIFSDEVDLCLRLRRAGWSVVFWPRAEFVHVGGVSTRPQWGRMYREQLRSHLRYFAKHEGLARAERARMLLLWALRLRALVFFGERGRTYRDAAAWLASADVREHLDASAA
jgi:N-acetylglucosaminyl-diphospho-decaprenol L-rhamnosyltransferase